ncbi:MAG: type 3 domain protein [Sediminibacterium sp.]|nr:type 3 domain protein [Sediminibacterium sp.]
MALQEKYKELISAAQSGISGVQIAEQSGVLHITGHAPSGAVKDRLWEIYGQIDPNYRAGDVVMDVDVAGLGAGSKLKVTTDSSGLNLRKGPGTDQPIAGKAAHGAVITLINKTNDQWWLVRTDEGTEGYAFAQYLSPLS